MSRPIKITTTTTFYKSENTTDYLLAGSRTKNPTYIISQEHPFRYPHSSSTIYLTEPMLKHIIKAYEAIRDLGQ